MEIKEKIINEINLNIMYLISIKDDLNLFYFTKHRIIGMIDLAHSVQLITDDQTIYFYNRLSLI